MAAIFLFHFFTSASIYCIFSLICLKRFIFLLSDAECYPLFRYIWFTYVFSTDKGVIFKFYYERTEYVKKSLAAAAIMPAETGYISMPFLT